MGAKAVAELYAREGFVEVIAGAFANGFDGRFGAVMRGHEDDIYGGAMRTMRVEDVHAGDGGHHQIEEDDVGPAGGGCM